MEYTPEQIRELIQLNRNACNHEETYFEASDITEAPGNFAIITYNVYCKKCNKHLATEKQHFTFSHIIERKK